MTERNKVPECEFDKIGKRDTVNALGRKRERELRLRESVYSRVMDKFINKERDREQLEVKERFSISDG